MNVHYAKKFVGNDVSFHTYFRSRLLTALVAGTVAGSVWGVAHAQSLPGDPATSLADIISAETGASSTISVTADGKLGSATNNTATISRDFTLNISSDTVGTNRTITAYENGKTASPLFKVTAGTFTLNSTDITWSSPTKDDGTLYQIGGPGGIISVASGASAVINGGNFTNLSLSGQGNHTAPIYFLGGEGTSLTVQNANFSNISDVGSHSSSVIFAENNANVIIQGSGVFEGGYASGGYGGIVRLYRYNQSVADNSKLTIQTLGADDKIIFRDNSTPSNGSGGVFYAGRGTQVIIDNTKGGVIQFENNTGSKYGGVAKVDFGQIIIRGSEEAGSVISFSENKSANGSALTLYVNSSTVASEYDSLLDIQSGNVEFSDNVNTGTYGAITIYGNANFPEYDAVHITGGTTTFSDNQGGYGAAIGGSAGIVIEKLDGQDAPVVNFTGNTARGVGGAIYLSSDLEISDSVVNFTDNTAASSGGAIYAVGDVIFSGDETQVTFSGNQVGRNGEYTNNDIVMAEADLTIQDGGDYSFEGGIVTSDGNLTIGTENTGTNTGSPTITLGENSITKIDGLTTISGENTEIIFAGNADGTSGATFTTTDLTVSNGAAVTFGEGSTGTITNDTTLTGGTLNVSGNAAVSFNNLNADADSALNFSDGADVSIQGNEQINSAINVADGAKLVLDTDITPKSVTVGVQGDGNRGGTLVVNANVTSAENINVHEGSTLAGNGSVSVENAGTVNVAPTATLTAEDSLNALEIGSSATGEKTNLNLQGIYNVNVNGKADGQYDTVTVNGTTTIDTDSTDGITAGIELLIDGYEPILGDALNILESTDGITFTGGSAESKDLTSLLIGKIAQEYFTLNYLADTGILQLSVAKNGYLDAVPEPGTITLLLLGVFGIFGLSYRRKNR
ncbi:MAG: PEP-CTERM sorting domain-containing protein [Planctomycetia bacterium]|nr:PEP-CTERM sorting domain-containing protein [Planctomycetia bacterium]